MMKTRIHTYLMHSAVLAASLLAGTQFAAAETPSVKAERNYIKEGNKSYRDSNYHAALEAYEKALTANPASLRAQYNKAAALTHLFSEDNRGTENDPRAVAAELFANVARLAATDADELELAEKAFYNLGNMAFNDEKYDESINFYKRSLLIRPDNLEARQNLRLAQLKKQEQEQNQDNQDQDKQDQEQQQQQNQDQQQQNQDQQEQQQQQQQMTGSAQQILQSMQNKENATRRKVQEKEDQPAQGRPQTDKPW